MTAIEAIGVLIALPLLIAAFAEWHDSKRLRVGPVAAMRALTYRANRRRV